MFDPATLSKGVKFALLEGQLLSQDTDRGTPVARAADLGLRAKEVREAADKFLAIAVNQEARRAALRRAFESKMVRSCLSSPREILRLLA